MKKLFATFILVLLAVGCSPIYKDFRQVYPPTDSAGQRCASGCSQSQVSCQAVCNLCRQQAAIDANSFARQLQIDCIGSNSAWCKSVKSQPINSASPTADYPECRQTCKDCQDAYDACFIGCGGRIDITRKCTAFCDKQ